MRLKNKLYIKIIAIFTLLLTLGIFLYSCKKPDKKVLFNLNGGSINGSQNSVEVVVKHGEKISSDKIPQPTKEKSRLLGWYNGENLFNFETEKIEKDITLLAKWQEQVSLSLPDSIKTDSVKNLESIDKDTNITLEYIPQAGKVLKSLKINGEEKLGELKENKLTFKIIKDTKVEVEYDANLVDEYFTLTLPSEVKANVSDLTKIKKDTMVELEYIPQAGKMLKSLKINGEEKISELVSNKLTFKIVKDTKVEVELENITNPYKAELDIEKSKVDALVKDGKIKLSDDVSVSSVKNKIEETVDLEKVSVNVVEKELGKKYEITLTHKKDTTLKSTSLYEFEKNEDLTNYLTDLDQEFEKIENAKVSGEIEINEEITKESVKARINQIIDESVVDVNITEVVLGKEYKVELVHKENNKAKKEQNVVFKKALQKYELTLTSDFEVVEPAGLNLSEVLKGTKIKVRVKTPEHKDIKEITKNNIPVLGSEIINNEYEFTMTQNITLKVSFKVKQEYINNLENEFNKLTNVRVIAPNGDIQEEKVKEKVLELVDGSIVSDVVVVKKGDKFEITLTHKLSDEAKVAKEILVLPEQVSITLDLQGKAKYNNSDKPVLKVNKGSKLVLENLPKANELVYTGGNAVFKSWTTDKEGNVPFKFNEEINTDTTIYAQYDEGYSITFLIDGDNVINRDVFHNKIARAVKDQTVDNIFGEDPITPGYKFLKWYNIENFHTFEFGVTRITKDITVKAEFKDKTYLNFEETGIDRKVRITGMNDKDVSNVYIPEQITESGVTYDIVAVAKHAFYKNNKIKSVTFLGGMLEEIHHSAFSMSSLEKVVLPQSLKVISDFAFSQTSIKKVIIPASVKTIGNRAFSIGKLSEVVFENPNYTIINKYQFFGSIWLTDGIQNEPYIKVANGVLLEVNDSYTNDMTLPSNVKKIGEWAFYGNKCTNLILNEGLEEISNYAFYKAEFGSVIKLPKSLKYIGFRAFAKTKKFVVEKLDLEENSNLEYIRAEAFYETGIKEVVLPEGLKEVGDKAFYFSTSLKKITFPTTLVKFGFKAFEDTAWYNDEVNKGHFIVANDTLLDASRMTAADTIPNVKRIAKGAFINIKNIEELEIPESVEYIYSYAFYLNGDLKKIKIPGTVKVIEKRGFIFETYYTGGNKDPIHLDVMVSDVESAPSKWDSDWNQIREHNDRKGALYKFIWAYKNKVLFDLDGGNVTGNINPQVLNKGDVATEPSIVPTKDGKVFVGWFLDDTKYDFTTPVNKSITLKARYADINNDYDLAYENNELVFVRLKNTSLQEFTIPADVNGAKITRIKKDAFKDNTTVKKVVIPDSVKVIEDDAFNGDTNLSDITFGSGVKEFGKDFIKDTKWLSQKQASDKAVVINKVLVDAKNLEENAELPSEIEKISKYAFSQNTTTKVLTIKDGTTTIEGNAFKGNTSIEKIVLPNTLLYAKKDAFAMGRSGSVEIDATLVSHQRPRTWEDGYDNGDGATLTFKWKQVIVHKVNLLEGMSLVDLSLYPQSIEHGKVIDIKVASKQYYKITKFTVNGEDKLEELIAGGNQIKITVNSDINFELEYDLLDDIKNEFMNEFNKLQDKMGYISDTGDEESDIVSHLSNFIDTSVVEINLSKNNDKYNVKFISKKVPSYVKEKENISFVILAKVNNPVSKATASHYVYGWHSESPDLAFDGNYRTKWCDNRSAKKWIIGELKTPMFVAQINIAHAEKGKEAASMNTRKFTIEYEGLDGKWHEWAKITDNRLGYSKHSFAGAMIKKIRLNIEQAEFSGNAASRIYEIELYAETELVTATFNLAGGNINGDSSNIIKKFPKNTVLTNEAIPNPVLKNHIIKNWQIVETGELVELGVTKLLNNYTIKAIWEIDPEIANILNENIKKIYDTEFVEKDSEEVLTKDEIIAHIEKKIDKDQIITDARLLHDDIWEVSLKLKADETIETKKEVEFIKKKPNEEVNVTYDLNGGLYDGSSNNILYNIAKGSKIAEDKIPDSAKLQKDNMVFEYWMIDNNYAEPLGYLLKKNVVFIAKWTSKPAKGTDLRDYIKDAKITKGSQDNYFQMARSIKNSYDKDKDGAPNKKTIFSIDTDFSNNEAEVVYEFKHLVEIEKINVALMGTAVATQKYNNLRKMEVYGSTDNNNWEKIGELDNPDGDNEKEITLTSNKPFKYIKLYANISEEVQNEEIDYFNITDLGFIAA